MNIIKFKQFLDYFGLTQSTWETITGTASSSTFLRGDGQWKTPITVSTSAPTNPVVNDLWYDIS